MHSSDGTSRITRAQGRSLITAAVLLSSAIAICGGCVAIACSSFLGEGFQAGTDLTLLYWFILASATQMLIGNLALRRVRRVAVFRVTAITHAALLAVALSRLELGFASLMGLALISILAGITAGSTTLAVIYALQGEQAGDWDPETAVPVRVAD
jgi:hypothetical protein